MKTYRVGPPDYAADRTLRAFRILFPAGHYLNNGVPGEAKETFSLRDYTPDPRCPEPRDPEVVSEEVTVIYTESMNGHMREACVVGTSPARVVAYLNLGKDVTEIA